MKRRRVLQLMAGSSGAGLAGCASLGGDDTTTSEEEGGNGAKTGNDDDDGEAGTPQENEPPEITFHEAALRENGTQLVVRMEGEDTSGIATAEIRYGDLLIEKSPEGNSFEIEDTFEEIHEADLEESPGTVAFYLEDTDGQTAREELAPREGSPLVRLDTETGDPGELKLNIDVSDDEGLHYVENIVNRNSEEIFEELVGEKETELEIILDADELEELTPGETNEIEATARNTVGLTTSTSEDQYVREFDLLENQEIEIGVVYLPWFDNTSRWFQCTDATPEAGHYTNTDHEAVSRHVDQMEYAGISRMMVNFSVRDGARPFLGRLNEGLPGELPVEVYLELTGREYWENENIEGFRRGLDFVRNSFLSYEHYAERDERPVISFWDARWVTWGGDELSQKAKSTIKGEFGEFGKFVDWMRDRLTVNGTEPYLIGGMGDHGIVYEEGIASQDEIDFASSFDALTNWAGKLEPGETVSQEDHFEHLESNFKGYNSFTEDHGTDYTPMIIPGFDDRSNDCWGDDRHVPRSPDYFEQLLELADDYRTIDRINIATWNDWPEGTVIEPGELRGEDHDTIYLETLREFVS